MCGGTTCSQSGRVVFQGLSPRVRGNLAHADAVRYRIGSIPACAGEPLFLLHLHAGKAVYPRVCGGTLGTMRLYPKRKGLSPRVRGNRLPQASGMSYDRSIPACAGEP